jgi:hypothetical protein
LLKWYEDFLLKYFKMVNEIQLKYWSCNLGFRSTMATFTHNII